ncbi:MAG: hypothetical protein KGD58_17675 [Candidatus Lokiarchaeota archaeon]|nr:hypothetical protein [Candidatus Lokiarchaeota archaeon]
MSEYDCSVKVVLSGDDIAGKTYLVTNFCKSYYTIKTGHTIGLEFHVKTLSVLGKKMKFNLWEFSDHQRFKPLAPLYFRGAAAAIIIFDINKPDFWYRLNDTVQILSEASGDIPIELITFNNETNEFQAILGLDKMVTADKYHQSAITEVISKPISDPELIFNNLGDHFIKRSNISPPPRPLQRPDKIRTEFKINKFLNLRLEHTRTNIYVEGRLFKQCKFLLLNISVAYFRDYDEIDSIDEAAEKLDRSMELGRQRKYHISPDIEFWGHCSNLQVWYENNYDTRILHSNLAFPLLKALERAGDPLAKKVFKEEIALRFVSGYPSVIQYLLNEKYLNYLSKEEKKNLMEDPHFIKNISKWYTEVEDIPKWLSKKIKKKVKVLFNYK